MTQAPRLPSRVPFLLMGLLVPLALAISILWLGWEHRRWDTLRMDASASFDRQKLLTELLSNMRAAETSQRGYVITGDDNFISDYQAISGKIAQELDRATFLYRGSPLGEKPIVALRRDVAAKFAEMAMVLNIFDTRGGETARRRVTSGEGVRLMMQLERRLDRIAQAEQRIGDARLSAYRQRTLTLLRGMWAVLGIGSIVLGGTLFVIWRQRRKGHAVEMRAFESARRNETILDSTADAIIIINPSGTIETINKAAARLLGWDASRLVRRDIDVIADIASGVGSFHERIGLIDGQLRKTYWTDRSVRHADGHGVPVDIAIGTMDLPDGMHIVASLRDISERKRMEQLKDDLISTVSHELRTPLTSIVGALGLLRVDAAGPLPEGAGELVGIASNNAQRLIRLINDMLDIDRIEAGKLRLSLNAVDLRRVVERACKDNGGLARAAAVTLDCRTGDEPMIVQADEDRLMQVVTNLLSNALKVSAEGGTVQIGVMRSAAGRRVGVYVDDTGPGIPSEFRGRIFGRFERSADSEGSSGTGLGLAIAREIVAQHGGEIWFEDRPEGGTRFAFSLQLSQPLADPSGFPGRTRILLCEGDVQIAQALDTQLTNEGYDCRIVPNARAAREAMAIDGYSLLLLDMALDDEDAFALARDVRRGHSPEKLSILMMSPASGDDGVAPLPLDLIDWIDKPIDLSRLRTAIRAAFRSAHIEHPTVLHLDDDLDTLDLTAAALKGEADILKATTLREAREILSTHTPHLAILDVHLEEGIGLDLLPDLLDAHGIAIPTIIYSAHDIKLDVAGQIDAILVKSRTSLPDLKATIRRVVATRHLERDRA